MGARPIKSSSLEPPLLPSTVCLKNAPTLASCNFDNHGLIVIIFGEQYQHTFENDMHIQLSFCRHFTYFICY